MTAADIAKLTDRQIWEIYLRPTDKEGKILSDDDAWGGPGQEEQEESLPVVRAKFFAVGLALGQTQEAMEKAWAVIEAKHGGKG